MKGIKLEERKTMENNQNRQMKIAVTLARMYGIFETLHPVEYQSNETVSALIRQWLDDYLDIRKETGKEPDIVSFFEEKSRTIS